MKKIVNTVKNNVFIGLFAILPITILVILFKFLFNFFLTFTIPLLGILHIKNVFGHYALAAIAIVILLVLLFVVGLLMRTRFGRFLFSWIEKLIFERVPGYATIKEAVEHFTAKTSDGAVFSRVALVDAFGSNCLLTGFVTDETERQYTVFVPTSPNPTSGYIFHVEKNAVFFAPDIKMEKAIKTIIGCGAGSSDIVRNALENNNLEKTAFEATDDEKNL